MDMLPIQIGFLGKARRLGIRMRGIGVWGVRRISRFRHRKSRVLRSSEGMGILLRSKLDGSFLGYDKYHSWNTWMFCMGKNTLEQKILYRHW